MPANEETQHEYKCPFHFLHRAYITATVTQWRLLLKVSFFSSSLWNDININLHCYFRYPIHLQFRGTKIGGRNSLLVFNLAQLYLLQVDTVFEWPAVNIFALIT